MYENNVKVHTPFKLHYKKQLIFILKIIFNVIYYIYIFFILKRKIIIKIYCFETNYYSFS